MNGIIKYKFYHYYCKNKLVLAQRLCSDIKPKKESKIGNQYLWHSDGQQYSKF